MSATTTQQTGALPVVSAEQAQLEDAVEGLLVVIRLALGCKGPDQQGGLCEHCRSRLEDATQVAERARGVVR